MTETAIDPAKLRHEARENIAALEVAQIVISELSAMVCERRNEVQRRQDRLRAIFGRLGVDLATFAFDSAADGDILLTKLAQLEETARDDRADSNT